VLASARVQSDAQREAIQAEEKARAERVEAAKQRREDFDNYLSRARELLADARDTQIDPSNDYAPSYVDINAIVTTLRHYVDDKSIDLPLAQTNEALALIHDLKPIHDRLQKEEDAAAAARVELAKAQAEREAAERKARIREEKRAIKQDDKQKLENLSDDDLAELGLSLGEAVADGAGPEVQAQLNAVSREWQRREREGLTAITDEDDLLTVLRRIKLPTTDDSGRGLQGELDGLRKEGVNFGTRQQLFDSKQGSLDRTAERLRGEGFNQIQTPDDVIEFTKRALAGERILPQPVVDFARKETTATDQPAASHDRLPHDNSAPDSPDPFTAHGSFITGSRVTAAQAIRIAARGRAARLHLTESDAGGAGEVGAGQLREYQKILPLVRDPSGGLVNIQTGRRLPQIGRGVEAYVYEDVEQGVVYKVYSEGTSSDRSIGMRVAIDGDGMAGLDTGQLPDIIEKTWAINELGGTPTEIVGFTQDGEIVVKQPRGNDEAQYERAQVLAKAHLQEIPADILPRIDMRSPLYYSYIAGQDVLLGDLHGKNFIGDTIGRGRINDLATHVLTAEELNKLPKLNVWIAERRNAARAQGSADFARAWHGSPHRGIEQEGFKLNKIGTGEGAQAYGWGIYFAGEREVSEHYRQKLGGERGEVKYKGEGVTPERIEWLANNGSESERIVFGHLKEYPLESGRRENLANRLEHQIVQLGSKWRELDDKGYLDNYLRNKTLKTGRAFEAVFNELTGKERGQLYSADIPEAHELLDWDKPFSEQPLKVQEALGNILDSLPPEMSWMRDSFSKETTGQNIYGGIADIATELENYKNPDGEGVRNSERAGSELLLKHGIPGLRYLAGNSRAAGEGSHNYVIWDESRLNKDIQTYYARKKQLEHDAKTLRDKAEQVELVAEDFKARIERIAPALMMRYHALVGDYDSLFSVGIRPEQLDGSEQAAHIVGAKTRILWFLQQNLRADKNGLMDERLRRDVLHEASHAWLNTLERDRKEFLVREWQRDINATDGWLAQMRKDKVELREGVATDWAEYWAERLAYENNQWASQREKWSIAGDRGLLAQIYAEFRQFLADAIDLLARAFTRTKRYNIDFRSFLTDARYAEVAEGRSGTLAEDTVLAAKAWHGSPHRGIEKEGFKLNKIGSGEGAQAYGWGIYFAGNKKVSEDYRRRLAVRSVDEIFANLSRETGRRDFVAELKGENIPEKYRPFLRALVKEKWAGREGSPARVINHVLGKQFDRTAASPELLAEVDKLKREEMGQLYSADIPEAHELLDWDKPLSEQPAQVQEALRAIYRELGGDLAKLQSPRGRDLYEGLRELALEKNPPPSTGAYEEAKADYAESEKPLAALREVLEAAKQKAQAAMEIEMGLPQLDASIKQAEAQVRRLWDEHGAQEEVLDAILAKNEKNFRNAAYWTPEQKQVEQAAIARLEELRLSFNEAQSRMKALRDQRPRLTVQIRDRLRDAPGPEVVRARAAVSEAYKRSEALRRRKEQLGYEVQVEQARYKKAIASELLLKHGVPGLRYLDGNSRAAGEGSHNYVIWDEARLNNDIQIYYARKAAKTREQIQRVIDAAKQPSGHAPQKADLGPVADWVVEAAAQQGFDIRGYKHTLDGSAVRHIITNHYNARAEARRGNIALTDADLLALPQLLETADKVIFGTQNNLHKDQIVYLKHMPDGSTLYLEEIRSGRGELAAVSARKYPATIRAESILSTLNPHVQDDSGNAPTVVERPKEVKGDQVRADFARKADDDGPKRLSYEQRLARNLHELEELNARIDELKDATTRQQKDAHRKLLGERNEKRMFIDAEFSGWRKLYPELADGQVVDPKATRKRILEKDLKEAEKHAERGNTFAEKHAEAIRRTIAREYPEGGNTVAQSTDSSDTDMMRQIQSVIDAAKQPARHAPQKADLGPVADWVAEAVKSELGIDVSDYRHVLDGSAVRHITKRHSNPKTETKIGQIAITEADFKSLPQVVASPDRIILGEKTDQHKDAIIYIKRMPDGSILYIEEVRTGRGELASTSMRKYPAARDLSSITATVPSYAQSDGGILSPTVIDAPPAVKSADAHAEGRTGNDRAPNKAQVTDLNEGRDHSVVPPLLGHTNIPPKPGQTVWQWLTDFIKGFRNFVPEVSPRDPNYAPLRQFYKAIKRATPQNQARVQEILGRIVKPLLDLGMGKQEADLYRKLGLIQQRIRKLERSLAEGRGGNDASQTMAAGTARELARLHAQVVQLNTQIEAQPYHLFNKLVLAEDYVWRAENLKDKDGQPLALPDGITLEQAKAEAARLQALATAHPNAAAINRAYQSHLELVAETWAELERRFPELKAVPTNPYYFPHHIINDKHPAKLARVRLDTAAEIRKYLIEPKGSPAPIETDYAKAMSLHLSAVYAHNSRADLVRDLIKNQFDKLPELRERAKELSEERGERVTWGDVFKEEYKHSGYVAWEPDDRLHLHSEAVVSKEKIAKRLGVALGDGDLQTELKKAGITQVQLLPTDIREALVPNAKETWIIPEKVAQALEAMIDRESRYEGSDLGSGVVRSLEAAQNLWKKHILFSPWNYIRYEYNNTTSDLEKLFSADPAVFGYLPSSLREVMDLFAENPDHPPTVEARIAKALGVMQSVTIREAGDLPQLKQFAALKARPERLRDIAKAASTLFLANGRSTIELSQLREATFRYAKFKADMKRLRGGARPVYGGAYWKDIEALKVTQVHRDLIGRAEQETQAATAEGRGSNESPANTEADTVRLEYRDFLENTPPVSDLDGSQFAKADTPLPERVAEWYENNGYFTITVPHIGTVTLDKTAVSRSMNHGMGRNKAIAFAAVPDVFLAGRIIHSEPMEGTTAGGQVYHVAAPVRIVGKDFVASVLLKADQNINRMYVHEVFLKEKLHAPKVGAVADVATSGKRADKGNGAIATVLREIYSVNTEAVSDSHSQTEPLHYIQAAQISLATFGDYGDISVSGQKLRRALIPFYSWIEINFRYHANLFRNLKDMVKAGEMAKADARCF